MAPRRMVSWRCSTPPTGSHLVTRSVWPPPSSPSVDQQPAPLRIILGSQALQTTVSVFKDRIASFEAQTDLAASTDFPPGE